jgi:hypothetical protein
VSRAFCAVPFDPAAGRAFVLAECEVTNRISPTRFRSRFGIRNEYQDEQRGGYTNFLMPRLAYLEVEAGRFLNPQTMLYPRPGAGVFGDNVSQVYNWNFEVGLRYFFNCAPSAAAPCFGW